MRIIGGVLRGRRLAAPQGSTTRPTADRVRQALFDSLAHAPWAGPEAIRGAHVLDAFAGTGAFGLEALSRGAMDAVFFEMDAAARHVLSANITACGMEGCTRIVAADATHPPPGQPCGLVFLDPPYDDGPLLASALSALASAGWIAPRALLVVETRARNRPSALERFQSDWKRSRFVWRADSRGPGSLRDSSQPRSALGDLLAERHYGAARVGFFRCS